MKASLAAHLSERLGGDTKAVRSVSGGCIHNAYQLSLTTGKCFFVKVGDGKRRDLLESEAFGLYQLADWGNHGLLVPQPVLRGDFESQTFLVLPWIDMKAGNKQDFRALGKSLALAHLGTQSERFGWSKDSFIGLSPQLGGFGEVWSSYFWELRLEPQWKWARNKGLQLPETHQIEEVILELLNHAPTPCLVHGDLWSGNVGFSGEPVLFDPAPYFADPEVDLAFSRMFAGFDESFYMAYSEDNPFPDGWETRVNIYNLYHYLNHYNLFGSSYGMSCLSLVRDLLQKPG